ncbi:hypothetical protein AAG897_00005 [Lacticaseibacillus rhamnosus]|uniref:hypothetical protein n=1 Tax=Lacticaseibacillus rhamnosus TaxID=47715 RepID=UPI00189F9772|nr:hypothetical protein [Lacticaseibacillus rhamnosus]
MENSNLTASEALDLFIAKAIKGNKPSVMAKGLLKKASRYKKKENLEKFLAETLQTLNSVDHKYALKVAQELVVLDRSYSEFIKKLNLPDSNG